MLLSRNIPTIKPIPPVVIKPKINYILILQNKICLHTVP